MLFNSLEFIVFFILFFCLYWFVFNKKIKQQNLLIVICSYIFYSFWDVRFLSLIIISTLIDYVCGLKISKSNSQKRKRQFLAVSMIANVGILAIFKYFNFFISSFEDLIFLFTETKFDTWHLNVILPVGISFYTFQSLSYTIDIYKNKLRPTEDFIAFASFVAFFPQLVAGPIERATNFLPQILNKREFNLNQSISGLKLVVWGLFKKIVIADKLSYPVNQIFLDYASLNGGELFLGAIFFSFQIYCDFSGYSDIAIGISKLLGFELMSNFKFPYFSISITQFWRRWHISLSTWFRDYVYIPLGGSNSNDVIRYRNVAIVFLVSGFWHGANWTFLLWGFIHFLIYFTAALLNKKYASLNTFSASKTINFFQAIFTFFLVTIAWIFFRSESIQIGFDYIYLMFLNFDLPRSFLFFIPLVMVFLFLEYLIKNNERELFFFKNRILNVLTFFCFYVLILSQSINLSEFIYFKF